MSKQVAAPTNDAVQAVLVAFLANNKVSAKQLPAVVEQIRTSLTQGIVMPGAAAKTAKAVSGKSVAKAKGSVKGPAKTAAKPSVATVAAPNTAPFLIDELVPSSKIKNASQSRTRVTYLGLRNPKDPIVPISESVRRDFLICLEDGKRFKMMKRHLRATYGMSPEEYKAKWGLPADYPMAAPGYSLEKSEYAKIQGLGSLENKNHGKTDIRTVQIRKRKKAHA